MTIQEAIKSGKNFRRRKHPLEWYLPTTGYSLRSVDIMADDWEIEEETIQITRSQLEEAFKKNDSIWTISYPERWEHFLLDLGFKQIL